MSISPMIIFLSINLLSKKVEFFPNHHYHFYQKIDQKYLHWRILNIIPMIKRLDMTQNNLNISELRAEGIKYKHFNRKKIIMESLKAILHLMTLWRF